MTVKQGSQKYVGVLYPHKGWYERSWSGADLGHIIILHIYGDMAGLSPDGNLCCNSGLQHEKHRLRSLKIVATLHRQELGSLVVETKFDHSSSLLLLFPQPPFLF
jgi:hypothetical protein